MIKVISFTICPFVQRVTALLEAKNIPYQLEFISLSNKPEWFMEISPNGQVPVLITENGTALFESDAIVEYIDDISQPLEDTISAEQKAINRAWSYQATKHYLAQCSAQLSVDAETLGQRGEKLDKAFSKMERAFGDGAYFNGDTLGNVDIAWLVLLHRADIIRRHSGYDFLAKFPKLKQWQCNLMCSGLAEKSVADDFEQRFVDFYLSDSTYLGRGQQDSSVAETSCSASGCC